VTTVVQIERRFGRIPLPKGEGAAKRRVRGTKRNCFLCGTPHPVLRTTLSLRERDSLDYRPLILQNQLNPAARSLFWTAVVYDRAYFAAASAFSELCPAEGVRDAT